MTSKIAWAAGFVDGEGYIGIVRMFDKNRGYYSYRVALDVAQVYREPLAILQELFGGHLGFARNNYSGYWHWRASGKDVVRIVKILLPYLVVKSRQAKLVCDFEFHARWNKVPVEIQERRAAMWAACSELNGGTIPHAERLSEKAPLNEGDAIVRPHGNDNHETQEETLERLLVQ